MLNLCQYHFIASIHSCHTTYIIRILTIFLTSLRDDTEMKQANHMMVKRHTALLNNV